MSFPAEIQVALLNYDASKGFWRRLFRRDQAAIRALRTLSNVDQMNLLKIYLCFVENMPKTTQESFKVYQAILSYLKEINFPTIPEVIDELHTAKVLKDCNLEILNNLNANQFENLASILKKLSNAKLLTEENLACISSYYEAPEKLSIIDSAMGTFLDNDFKQADFSKLFKLLNGNNQFLLTDEAYHLVWRPLETQFPILCDTDEIFNKINVLAQQDNPAEKIGKYMHELISTSDIPRSRANTSENKFYTAPKPAKSRDSIDNLVDSLSRSVTL